MEIVKMTNEYYSDVYELWLSCRGMGLNNLDDSEQGINKFLQRNPDTCFVALQNEKVVGVIMAGSDGRRGYIYHTAVNSLYRKRGIATALVETVMQAMKNIGINKVHLLFLSITRAAINSGKGSVSPKETTLFTETRKLMK